MTGTQPLLAFILPQEAKLPLPSSLSSISFHPGLLLHLSTGLLKPGSPGNQGKSDRECGSQQKLGSPCTLPFLALPQPISSLPIRQALPGGLYKCRVLGSYTEHGVNCRGVRLMHCILKLSTRYLTWADGNGFARPACHHWGLKPAASSFEQPSQMPLPSNNFLSYLGHFPLRYERGSSV